MNTLAHIGADNIIALLPIIVLSVVIIGVMLAAAFYRRHAVIVTATLFGLVLSAGMLSFAAKVAPQQITPLLVMDSYALFYMGLILAASFAVALLSYNYFARRGGYREEFYLLLLLATLGAIVLVASTHFASFFIGLEILSVALFGLVAYPMRERHPLEAGIKYLVLSGVSSAFLLFGMALVYAQYGSLQFTQIGLLMSQGNSQHTVLVLTGLALIITGVGFKLSLVPFHLWTPDVYEGASAPVTAFLATVSKGAMFALLLRFFIDGELYRSFTLLLALSALAIASMLVGNLLALLQNNLKRILAYSSIAHIGYLLVALIAGGPLAVEAVSYYLVAYFVMTLGAFGVVSVMSAPEHGREADRLEDYRGLFWRRPGLAASFTAMLLSLAGIPLTVGFVGKFYLFAAGVNSALWLLLIILVIGSAIGLFYYLRIIVMLYMPVTEQTAPRQPARIVTAALAGGLTLAVLTVLLIWLGIYPTSLIRMIQATTAGLA